MLDNKALKQIEKRVKNCLTDRTVLTKQKSEYTEFFLNNAKDSLNSASVLSRISTSEELQKAVGYPDFKGFLWVINASYYSMFYMARALLEKGGIKIKRDQNIHMMTFDAVVYFFYLTGKLQKKLVEDFEEAGIEAGMALAQQKAFQLVQDYEYEKQKRGDFTYEMGFVAMENKAKTSLERANNFNEEIKKIISL